MLIADKWISSNVSFQYIWNFPLVDVYFRNEEILTLWAIARIGDDIFQDGELSKDAISRADFDLIDWPNHVGSGPSDEKRQEFILNSILNDFW